MRNLAIGVAAMLSLPGLLGADEPAPMSSASLMLVEEGRDAPVGAVPLAIACHMYECGPVCPAPGFAFTLVAHETGIIKSFLVAVQLRGPAVVGTTLTVTNDSTRADASQAYVTVSTVAEPWVLTGGTVRIDANDFSTTTDHLAVTLTGITDGAGRTLDGTVDCYQQELPDPLDGTSDDASDGASDDAAGCGGGGD